METTKWYVYKEQYKAAVDFITNNNPAVEKPYEVKQKIDTLVGYVIKGRIAGNTDFVYRATSLGIHVINDKDSELLQILVDPSISGRDYSALEVKSYESWIVSEE